VLTIKPCRKRGDFHGTVYGRDWRFGLVRRLRWTYVAKSAVIETDDGGAFVMDAFRCRTGHRPP
jgi:hypothetical protein